MWDWVEKEPLGNLGRPPIVEVVCGAHFDSLPLDPVVAGAFWNQQRDRYPLRELQPALQAAPDPGGLMLALGPQPLRTWLASPGRDRLVQIQHDRFYLNWRLQPGGEYPRFSSGENALLAAFLEEFEKFSRFCETVVGSVPAVRKVELGKVDHFAEGEHWNGRAELDVLLPVLAPALRFAEGDSPDLTWRLHDRKGAAEFTAAAVSTLTFSPTRDKPLRGIRVETFAVLPLESQSIQDRLREANRIVNSAFALLVPGAQQNTRFHPRSPA
jgi:uncharacterized protein (TIGR04255 family)